jgi:Spy/CpxP family protein refolding chaperone
MKYSFVIISALLVFMVTSDAFSQPSRRGPGNGNRFENLNLTDSQKEKVQVLRENHLNQVNNLRDELDRLRIDKRALMRSKDIDRSKVMAHEKKMIELREQIALSRMEFRLDVYELLDDKQKEQFSMRSFDNDSNSKRGGAFFKSGRRGFCR